MGKIKVDDLARMMNIPAQDLLFKLRAIGVRVDQSLYGATQTLTDVGELASKQVAAEQPWTIARAVVRRATNVVQRDAVSA